DVPAIRTLTPKVTIIENEIGMSRQLDQSDFGNRGAGIRITDVSLQAGSRLVITKNWIGGNDLEGIAIERSRGVEVEANSVTSDSVALLVSNSEATKMFDNELRSTGRSAVIFDGGTKGTQFGNLEAGNIVSSTGMALFVADGSGNTIVGN